MAPWWQRLPADFYRHSNHTALHDSDFWKVHLTAALDRVARTLLGTLMSVALAPEVLPRRRLQRQREELTFYRDRIERGVEAVFVRPQRGVTVHEEPVVERDGIAQRLLSFDSAYEPLHPALRERYRRFTANSRAHAQHWTHPEGPRPTLIFLHGYLLDSHAANSRMFSLPWLYRQGYDILLVTLPFHGRRREPGDPFSGYGYFAHGLAHINEAMLQAIHDVRVWMDVLEARGVPAIGVSGLSLGGYLSALLAAVDDRLAFCIPNSPVVSVIDMCLEWLPLRWLIQAGLARGEVSLVELRHATAIHAALSYAPKLAPERCLIIGGAGDRFTPPRFVELLHRHWSGSRLIWFPGNHVLHLRQREYLREMRQFMDRCAAEKRS